LGAAVAFNCESIHMGTLTCLLPLQWKENKVGYW